MLDKRRRRTPNIEPTNVCCLYNSVSRGSLLGADMTSHGQEKRPKVRWKEVDVGSFWKYILRQKKIIVKSRNRGVLYDGVRQGRPKNKISRILLFVLFSKA